MALLFSLGLGACDGGSGGKDLAAAGSGGQPSAAGAEAQAGKSPVAGAGSGGTSVASAGSAGSEAGSVAMPDEDAPSRDVTFTPSDAVISNPERGFYATADLVAAPDLSELRASGVTLVHSYVRLDAYRTSDIPQSLLDQATAGFEQARSAGVKVILRFAYNFGPYPDSEPDAPAEWVLKHIEQLKPLLVDNADVIAVVQAGFIGAWGEWHTSTNDLTQPAVRKTILETLVDAVPASRSVQLRYPPYKRALYGEPLTAALAFDGSYAARVGHHNDCFVSSETDVGTYPDAEVELFRDYVGADTAFVPMGGETCAVSAPRSECPSALSEMAKLHFSYINREFHEGVLASWSDCRTEMEQRLGYRLSLLKARLPERVKPGGSFTFRAELANSGFAAPFNARPVVVVLRGPGMYASQTLQKPDVRRWLAGGAVEARVRVGANVPEGTYELGLRLPDASVKLSAKPEFCLRFANDDVWDETAGMNVLGTIEVSAAAPGTSQADFMSFEVLAESD